MTFSLVSETYGRLGNDAGDAGASVVEGAGLLQHEVLLREAIQNSWDHRVSRDRGPIDFHARTETMSDDQRQMLGLIFSSVPTSLNELENWLAGKNQLGVLVIEDLDCSGLGGNLRPDDRDTSEKNVGWKNFVFNSGKTPFRQIGGGFFGFGKAVFFASSHFGTCVIYTQTRSEKSGEIQYRLIGKALTTAGEFQTGRHWWGIEDGDGGVLPLEGQKAREMALALGLTSLSSDRTGTSVAILNPSVGELKFSDLSESLMNAAIKWAWPLMVSGRAKQPRVNFNFWKEGTLLPLPDVATDETYGPYVKPFLEVSEGLTMIQNVQARDIKAPRARTNGQIGRLAYAKHIPPLGRPDIPDLSNHVALMRRPLLVVAYEKVNRDQFGHDVAGVFLASDEFDETFAKAEPVAHDAWKESKLNGQGLPFNPVKLLRNSIKAEFPDIGSTSLEATESDPGIAGAGIVANSRKLGELLTGLVGTGLSPSNGPGGLRDRKPFKVSIEPNPILSADKGDIVSIFKVTCESFTSDDPALFELNYEVGILIDEGKSESLNEIAPERRPLIQGWRDLETGKDLGPSIPVAMLLGQALGFSIKHKPDVGITFSASVVKGVDSEP